MTKKIKKDSLVFQVWYKQTMRSRPKLVAVLPDTHYTYESAKETAIKLKKERHWSAVSVVKVVTQNVS